MQTTYAPHAFPAPSLARPGAANPSLWRAGLATAAMAAAANALLYTAGSQVALFPQDVLIPGVKAPITLTRVVIATVVGVLGAVATLAVLRRRVARPFAIFQVVAAVVLLVSFTQPSLVLRDAPLRMVLALNALHTMAAALTLLVLRRAGGDKE